MSAKGLLGRLCSLARRSGFALALGLLLVSSVNADTYDTDSVAILRSLQGQSHGTDYHIGGPAADYNGLLFLFADKNNGSDLNSNDRILMHSNDRGLKGQSWYLGDKSLSLVSGDAGQSYTISMADDSAPLPQYGGIFNFDAQDGQHLILKDLIFSGGQVNSHGNDNSGVGGAFYAESLDLSGASNVAFNNNQASGAGESSSQGGAIYAEKLDLSGAVNMRFNDNRAQGNGAFNGQGGAIRANSLDLSGSGKISFTDNQAIGHSGAYSGMGGAVYADTSLYMNNATNISFTNNSAQGTDGGASGRGGAAYSGGSLDLNGASKINFNGNSATGTVGDYSGMGGALGSAVSLSMNNATDISFTNNSAQGGDGSYNAMGGAIYNPGELKLDGADRLLFASNMAQAGSGNFSGWGGALYTTAVDMSNAANLSFIGNKAMGGAGEFSGNGGAIYLTDNETNSTISGASFVNNQASTSHDGDMSSGRGGAIYVWSKDRHITLFSSADNNLLFQGNTHNPGNSGQTPNSIYFANIYGSGDNYTVNLKLATDANSAIYMYDPMASQADDFIDLDGDMHGNVELWVHKDGDGALILGGHNDMQSASHWFINQGTLHMVDDVKGNAAHINLSHPGSQFTLKNGTSLLLTPGLGSHMISANTITLESGSLVGLADNEVTGPAYMPTASYEVLALKAGVDNVLSVLASLNPDLTNESGLIAIEGEVSVMGLTYKYENLAWNDTLDILTMDVTAPFEPTDESKGAAAVGMPANIVANLNHAKIINDRSANLFARRPSQYEREKNDTASLVAGLLGHSTVTPGYALERAELLARNSGGMESGLFDSQPLWLGAADGGGQMSLGNSSIWMTPSFTHVDNSANPGYTIKSPNLAAGFDHWFNDKFFLGAAFIGAIPEYQGPYLDVDAKNLTGVVYGGVMLPQDIELGAFMAYGKSNFEQKRRSAGQTYSADYDADNYNLGLSLGRKFEVTEKVALRPFANYEYVRVETDGYDENAGPSSLKVDSHNQNLHFVQVGGDITYTSEEGAWISGRAYYAGLYGDTEAETEVIFAIDPRGGRYNTISDAMDEHSLGLGLSVGLPLGEHIEFQAGYNLMLGSDSVTQQADLSLAIKF